ncbi:MAG TPA: hypothetical protein VG778_01935 [Blastocatellia bacterium]|nr:hypothetical protein [Blastocatellia bacterium]
MRLSNMRKGMLVRRELLIRGTAKGFDRGFVDVFVKKRAELRGLNN